VLSTATGLPAMAALRALLRVVVGSFEIGLVCGGLVVDGALIDELAGGVDDEHVRGGFGFVEAADGAGGVEEDGG